MRGRTAPRNSVRASTRAAFEIPFLATDDTTASASHSSWPPFQRLIRLSLLGFRIAKFFHPIAPSSSCGHEMFDFLADARPQAAILSRAAWAVQSRWERIKRPTPHANKRGTARKDKLAILANCGGCHCVVGVRRGAFGAKGQNGSDLDGALHWSGPKRALGVGWRAFLASGTTQRARRVKKSGGNARTLQENRDIKERPTGAV